jgi:hypothetical protein
LFIRSWLYVFVAYVARDYHALVRHSRLLLAGVVPELVDDEPAADDRMQIEQERQIVPHVLNRLEPALRELPSGSHDAHQ